MATPVALLVTTSSLFSMSEAEKVCGYLRHISSNTCVGEDSNKYLIARNTSCSKQNHLFCYDTKKMIIAKGSGGEKVISMPNENPGPDQNSFLMLTNEKKGQYKWRFRNNGEVRLDGDSNIQKCWRRSADEINKIKLDTCFNSRDETTLNQHQFELQRRYEITGTSL